MLEQVNENNIQLPVSLLIIAARLEQINKELNSSILISNEVYSRIKSSKDNLDPILHRNILIKGMSNPFDVYQLV